MRSERRASACCKKYALSIRRINKIKKPSCKTQLGFCYIKLQLRQSQTNIYISLNTAANPPEGGIAISALSALVTDIFTLLYPR